MSEIITVWSVRDDDGFFTHIVFDKLHDALEHIETMVEDACAGDEFEIILKCIEMEQSQYDQLHERDEG